MTEGQLRRILRAFTDELRSLSREIRSIHEEQQTSRASESKQPVRPIPVEIKAESITHHAIREYYEAENHDRQTNWRKLKPWVETIGVVIAVILAGFTLFTMLEIRKQTPAIIDSAKAAGEAAKTVREQVHNGQRAYVVAHHAVLTHPPRVNEGLEASIDWTNSGQTPAVEVLSVAHLFIATDSTSQHGAEIPMMPVGANQLVRAFSKILSPLTKQDVADIIADPATLEGNRLTVRNLRRLFFVGVVHYKDVFGQSGETKFCNVYMRDAFVGCLTKDSNTLK